MNEGQLPTNQLLDCAYICAWIRTNISMRIRDKGITYIERERGERGKEKVRERNYQCNSGRTYPLFDQNRVNTTKVRVRLLICKTLTLYILMVHDDLYPLVRMCLHVVRMLPEREREREREIGPFGFTGGELMYGARSNARGVWSGMCTNLFTLPSQLAYKSRVPSSLGSSRPEEDWSIQSKRRQDNFQRSSCLPGELSPFQSLLIIRT